jgi:hypothetical protein
MDPEIRKVLDEVHALAKDNHRLLRAVRRHQILELFGRYVLWIVVILLTYYSYVTYAAPFIQKFSASPSAVTPGSLGLPTSADLQKLINSYKPGG